MSGEGAVNFEGPKVRSANKVIGAGSASEDETVRKRAFRKKMREYHPDVNKNEFAEHRFKTVNSAVQALEGDENAKQDLVNRETERIKQEEAAIAGLGEALRGVGKRAEAKAREKQAEEVVAAAVREAEKANEHRENVRDYGKFVGDQSARALYDARIRSVFSNVLNNVVSVGVRLEDKQADRYEKRLVTALQEQFEDGDSVDLRVDSSFRKVVESQAQAMGISPDILKRQLAAIVGVAQMLDRQRGVDFIAERLRGKGDVWGAKEVHMSEKDKGNYQAAFVVGWEVGKGKFNPRDVKQEEVWFLPKEIWAQVESLRQKNSNVGLPEMEMR